MFIVRKGGFGGSILIRDKEPRRIFLNDEGIEAVIKYLRNKKLEKTEERFVSKIFEELKINRTEEYRIVDLRTKGIHRFPWYIRIEITTFCNASCPHCYVGKVIKKEMEYSKILDLINRLDEYGIAIIELTGGEPTLHSKFYDIIKEIVKRKIVLYFPTNGSIELDWKILYKLKGEFFNTYIFSLDLPGEENFKYRRINSKLYKNFLYNIEKAKKGGFRTISNVTISELNKNKVEEILEYLEDLQVDQVNFLFAVPSGNALENKAYLDFNEIQKITRRIKRLKKKYSIKINIHGGEISYCPALRDEIYIDVEGNVYPCAFMKYSIGNVFKQSFPEILNSERSKIFMKSFDKNQLIKKKYDGCKAAAYNLYGSFFAIGMSPYKYQDLDPGIYKILWKRDTKIYVKIVKELVNKFRVKRIIDVGGGTGSILKEILREVSKGEDIEVYYNDISERMAKYAKKILREYKVKFVVGPIEENYDIITDNGLVLLLGNTIASIKRKEFEKILKEVNNKNIIWVIEFSPARKNMEDGVIIRDLKIKNKIIREIYHKIGEKTVILISSFYGKKNHLYKPIEIVNWTEEEINIVFRKYGYKKVSSLDTEVGKLKVFKK